jgi:hypothetical protein
MEIPLKETQGWSIPDHPWVLIHTSFASLALDREVL